MDYAVVIKEKGMGQKTVSVREIEARTYWMPNTVPLSALHIPRPTWRLVRLLEAKHYYRSTVVLIVQRHDGKYGVARQNTPDRQWGFIQGHVEPTDEDPISAALREAQQEACITADMISLKVPYLSLHIVRYPKGTHSPVYARGSCYTTLGIRLAPGAEERLNVADAQELLEWKWCNFEEAMALLETQPGMTPRSADVEHKLREKTERVLMRALSIFHGMPKI